MKINGLLLAVLMPLFGCSIINSKYVQSSPENYPAKRVNDVAVFYSAGDVPFHYKEIGRVFIKPVNYWADRDQGGQVNKIKKAAAAKGADAVIVDSQKRFESSNYGGGGSAGEVYLMNGIAIVKQAN